jgi:tetratricopeptide (TPR) repeat protein
MTWLTALLYFFIFTILLRHPYVLLVVVLAYIFRDRIPDPSAYVRRSKAFSRLKYAVSVNPHDSTARRDLGMVLLEKKRPKEALENLLDALKKDDSAEINHLVGVAYLRCGQAEKAAEHLKKAISLDPRFKYGETYFCLGEALLAAGRPDEALEYLKAGLSINNTSIEGLYQYARALSMLGRKDEARKAAEDGIRYHKANPGFRRRRDWRSYVKLKGLRRGL